MDKKTLFVFNPEHDLALGVGKGPYTPPSEILRIRHDLTLLPAIYAGNSDFILIPADIEDEALPSFPHFNEVKRKNISLLRPADVSAHIDEIREVYPWGWDHAIVRELEDAGIPRKVMPRPEFIEKVRSLSHRRTTIPFRNMLYRLLDKPEINPAHEIFLENEIEPFLSCHPVSFFKAPWSSSGRGIVVSDHISGKGLTEWAHGIIRRQGSIIAEPAWDKTLDFATEWLIKDHKAYFMGLSVFFASSRGKYHGNIRASQKELASLIREKAPEFNEDIIEAQKKALEVMIAPFYFGPLGIDMLADSRGLINACVEINLRMTMGYVSLFQKKD